MAVINISVMETKIERVIAHETKLYEATKLSVENMEHDDVTLEGDQDFNISDG